MIEHFEHEHTLIVLILTPQWAYWGWTDHTATLIFKWTFQAMKEYFITIKYIINSVSAAQNVVRQEWIQLYIII